MNQYNPFHLSLPCRSITETRKFYVDIIGAIEGRATSGWIDIDLFGNQITFTKSGVYNFDYRSYKFEDAVLPSFHFGVIVGDALWETMHERLKRSGLELTPDYTFLKDKPGEHKSFFITDPNGHTVEFKCFTNAGDIFER